MNTAAASLWDGFSLPNSTRRFKKPKVENDRSFWAAELDALNWNSTDFVNGGTTMRELTEPWESLTLWFPEEDMVDIADRLLLVIARMSVTTPWDSPDYEFLRQGQRYCTIMLRHRESADWVEWKERVLLWWYTFRDGSHGTWYEPPLPTEVVWRSTRTGWIPDRVELPEPEKQAAEPRDDWSDDEGEADSVCSDTDSESDAGDEASSHIIDDIAEDVSPAEFEAAYTAEVLAALEIDLEENSSAMQRTVEDKDNNDSKLGSRNSAASDETIRQL